MDLYYTTFSFNELIIVFQFKLFLPFEMWIYSEMEEITRYVGMQYNITDYYQRES